MAIYPPVSGKKKKAGGPKGICNLLHTSKKSLVDPIEGPALCLVFFLIPIPGLRLVCWKVYTQQQWGSVCFSPMLGGYYKIGMGPLQLSLAVHRNPNHGSSKKGYWNISTRVFYFVANFRHPATNKRANESHKGIFEDLKKQIAISRKKKRLKVARFRQCVSLGRQNWAGFQKRSTSPPGQSPFIAN